MGMRFVVVVLVAVVLGAGIAIVVLWPTPGPRPAGTVKAGVVGVAATVPVGTAAAGGDHPW